jgi:hypothetical protein
MGAGETPALSGPLCGVGAREAEVRKVFVIHFPARSGDAGLEAPVPPPIDDVKNWMHMFRWIVKLIRDEYEVDESILVRTAVLEKDCGLIIEQVEALLGTISASFTLTFPPGTLDEVLKLDELCMLASWMKGLYKRPEFISDGFEASCRAINPGCG